MPTALIKLKSIDVHNTDEDDGAEWHLTVGINDGGGHPENHNTEAKWDWDDVDSGWSYGLDHTWQFHLNPGEQIWMYAHGFEEDDPGFPLFDDHDNIPGFGFWIDPSSPAVYNGNDYIINGKDQDFDYTLHYDIQYSPFDWLG